jgi:serine/threonine-protein kinase
VVAALQLKLLPGARPALRAIAPEAHDLYLQGLSHLARGSGEGYARAVEVLQRAVEREPAYAEAWAALARALYWSPDQNVVGDTAVEWPRAQRAAEQAIALAPGLADGYVSRALLGQTILRDWPGARADLERARALNPGAPYLMELHADLLATLGRVPEALPVLEQAERLDPLSADLQTDLALAHLGLRHLPEAERYAARALALSPEHARAARTMGFALLLQGRHADARAAFHRSSNAFFADLGEAMVAHAQGRAPEARRVLDRILALPTALKGSYQIAELYAWRGEPGPAFAWLEKAERQHDPGLTYLEYDPLLQPLRADPRFTALLVRLRLPPG